MTGMVANIHQLEIFDGVVQLVAVYVMDLLSRVQLSTKRLLHHMTVFFHAVVIHGYASIIAGRFALSVAVTILATKFLDAFPRGRDREWLFAPSTVDGDPLIVMCPEASGPCH